MAPKIAVAWETLRDPEERKKHDQRHRDHYQTGRHQTDGNPNSQSAWNNTTRASSSTGNDKARENSEQMRRGYEEWMQNHRRRVGVIQQSVNEIKSEVEKLQIQDELYSNRLAADNSWLASWSPWATPKLSAEQKESMNNEKLQRMAARRVKEARLSMYMREMGKLQEEMTEKGERELRRRAEEARAENQRRAQEQLQELRKQAAERERLEKERQERVKRESERQEKVRMEQVEAARKLREKLEEQRRVTAQRHKNSPASEIPFNMNRFRVPNGGSTPSNCRHNATWKKIGGRQICPRCNQTQFRFILQCPTCQAKGCYKCMKARQRETAAINRPVLETWDDYDVYD
jgi:hypothetical protein